MANTTGEGATEAPRAAWLFLANGSEATEDNAGELSETHADLKMTENFFKTRHQRKDLRIVGNRCGVCITKGIGTMDPRAVINQFIRDQSLEYFFLIFTGHGNKESLWVFDQYTVGLMDIIRLWYFARCEAANPDAKLTALSMSASSSGAAVRL